MKKSILLILLFFPLFVYGQDTLNADGYNVFHYPNGQISSKGYMTNGKPDGLWLSYYPSGILKSEGKRTNHLLDSIWLFFNESGDSIEKISYILGKRNGYSYRYSYKDEKNFDKLPVVRAKELYVNDMKEGRSFYYRKDGSLEEMVTYKDGLRNGISMEYGKDTLVSAYRVYVNDVLVESERVNRRDKNGWKQGVWREYDPDGRIRKEAYYRNDTLDGLYKEFNAKGALSLSLMYRNGKIREFSEADTATVQIRNKYDEKGVLIYSGPFKSGTPVGIHRDFKDGKVVGGKLYDDLGTLIGDGIIDMEGNKQGPWTFYYTLGKPKSKGAYSNNERTGKWTFFYESGQEQQKGEYRNDLPDGRWVWYYPDGNILREEDYLNGKEDGHYVEYNDDGSVITEGDYVEGEKEGFWTYHVGDMKEEGKYISGLRDGVWKYYYDNGNLMFQGNYVQGNPDGKHLYYYDTGELKEECIYVMGLKEKNWKKFDKLGNVDLVITYKDDQEVRINGQKIELPAPDRKMIK